MLDKIKNLALVVLLTGLIWAWAEQSQTADLNKQSLEVEIAVAENSGLVLAADAAAVWRRSIRKTVIADFRGQQSRINQLAELIKGHRYQVTYTLNPADVAGRDKVELDLAEVLNRNPKVPDVLAEAVYPARLELHIGLVRPYNLAVQPRFSDGIERQVTVKPAVVGVNLPPGFYESLKEKVLRVDVQVENRPDPARPIEAALPTVLDGHPISPNPPEVEITINFRMVEYKVEKVPVQMTFPLHFPLAEYELHSDRAQWLKMVKARGPADSPLSAEDVRAYLDFSMDDIASKQPPRDVRIVLPPGFELITPAPGSPDRRIDFTFVKRPEKPATP